MVIRFIRRRLSDWQPSYRAVRKLYRTHIGENGARALRLLRSWLSPTQRLQFDANRSFDVTGCDSGRRYRIHWGKVSNVYEIDQADEPITGLCFAPAGNLPEGDIMLAQKIALETSEHKTLALANRFLPRFYAPGRQASMR